jgi:hypothetical protein
VLEAVYMLKGAPLSDERLDEYIDTLCRTPNWGVWLQQRIPCIFLVEDKCTVYPYRPWVCRSHFVSSPAAQCSDITAVDSTLPIQHTNPMYFGMLNAAAAIVPLPYGAIPLPLSLKWARVFLQHGIVEMTRVYREDLLQWSLRSSAG